MSVRASGLWRVLHAPGYSRRVLRIGAWMAGTLLVAGSAGAAAHFAAGGPGCRPRDPASGGIGVLRVYGQTADGPVALPPGTASSLPRPQELVFWFEVDGTGTRDVRVEVDVAGRRQVVAEERLTAPFPGSYLEPTVKLDERAPDRLTLRTVIEPPHAPNVVTEYRLRLVGARRQLDGPAATDSR